MTACHPIDVPALLYRCPNPTNWLCPCGRVARELKRAGIAHETVRMPYRRRDRGEVEELTGQQRVPVLVLDEQAIVDSRRIVEHLRWRASTDA
jgi:glutathione S-transferase